MIPWVIGFAIAGALLWFVPPSGWDATSFRAKVGAVCCWLYAAYIMLAS